MKYLKYHEIITIHLEGNSIMSMLHSIGETYKRWLKTSSIYPWIIHIPRGFNMIQPLGSCHSWGIQPCHQGIDDGLSTRGYHVESHGSCHHRVRVLENRPVISETFKHETNLATWQRSWQLTPHLASSKKNKKQIPILDTRQHKKHLF